MPRYRIELAKTGRSSCRECGKLIDVDAPRFGTDDNPPGSRWFHLECAAAGAPRAFQPFAKRAKAFAAKAPSPAAGVKPASMSTSTSVAVRNPDLEAAIIRVPKKREVKLVYADWLQAKGDPWGELIAFALANEEKAAKKVLKQYQANLTGSFKPTWFRWEDGVIVAATLEARDASGLSLRYGELRALRTAAFLESMGMPVIPDGALIEAVSANPPPCMTSLLTWVGPGLGALRFPRLEELRFCITRPVADHLAPLFALPRSALPKLRALELYDGAVRDRALPVRALEQLLASPLLRGLRRLSLTQGALNDAGVDFLLKNANRLKHLEDVNLGSDLEQGQERRAKKAFGAAFSRFGPED
jgi:uncharacterized protein (TIGR02996 family)